MATLKEAIQQAQNGTLPKDKADKLKQMILSGKMDAIAQKEGIDIEPLKNAGGKKTVETPGFLKNAAQVAQTADTTTDAGKLAADKGANVAVGLTTDINTAEGTEAPVATDFQEQTLGESVVSALGGPLFDKNTRNLIKDTAKGVFKDMNETQPEEGTQKILSTNGSINPLNWSANPGAPLQNFVNKTPGTVREGFSNLASGLSGQVKKYGSFVQPGLGALPQDRTAEKGEALNNTFKGAAQLLSSTFMPLIQSLPGGEKAATLIDPATWAVNAFRSAAEQGGIDTSSEDYLLAEDQIRTAGNVADVALIPPIYEGLKNSKWFDQELSKLEPETSTKVQKVVNNRIAELEKLESSNSIVRKVIDESKSKGIDLKQIVSETDLLKGAVDKDGSIRTSTDGGAIDQLQEFIKPQEDVISKVLEREGKTINLSDLEAQLKEAVSNNKGLTGSSKTKALNAISEEIEGLRLDADEGGNISLSKIQDAKTNKYSMIDYTNPTAKTIDKLIAKQYKEIIEKNTESVDVKKLNQELATHYAVLKFLEKLDGKKVKGGRMGKYFGTTIGSIVGSQFGVLGSLVGAKTGELIQGKLMESTFEGSTGKVLEQSDLMKNALNPETSLGNQKQ